MCKELPVRTDTDGATDSVTRKSVQCAVTMDDLFLLSYQMGSQGIIAQSSGEADFVGINIGLSDLLYCLRVFAETAWACNLSPRSDNPA